MASPDNQHQIVAHAVLCGLTPLIPIPFVDDLVLSYFKRRLISSLATSHGLNLSDEQVAALSTEPGGGCLPSYVSTLLLYPLRKVLRKILIFLEWKRALDLVSRTYYQGYLLDVVLREGWCAPAGPRSAIEVRTALDKVLSRTDTSLVNRAAAGVFSRSKGLVTGAARFLASRLPGRSRHSSAQDVAQAMADAEAAEEEQLGGVINQLQNAISAMPAEHFRQLRTALATELDMTAAED